MRNLFPVLAIAAVLFAFPACKGTSADTATAADSIPAGATGAERTIPANPDGTVHQLTDPDLYTPGARVEGLTLLYFNAVWNGPCRQLGPVFAQMAEQFKGRATFVSVDTDKYPGVMQAYGLGTELPVVLILCPDGTAEHFTGIAELLPASRFKSIIEKNIN